MRTKKFGLVCWSLGAHKAVKQIESGCDYIRKSHELGFGGVVLAPMLLPEEGDRAAIDSFRKCAADHDMFVEFSALGSVYTRVADGSIGKLFEHAKKLGASVVTSHLENCGARLKENWPADATKRKIETLVKNINAIGKAAENAGVKVAFENHIDYRSDEVTAIASGIDSPAIGFLFDTANQLALLDDPVAYKDVISGRIISTHIKDAYAVGSADGADLIWCVPGAGLVDFEALRPAILDAEQKGVHLSLELIVPQPWAVPYKTPRFAQAIWGGKLDPNNAMLKKVEQQIAEKRQIYPADPAGQQKTEARVLKESVAAMKKLFS